MSNCCFGKEEKSVISIQTSDIVFQTYRIIKLIAERSESQLYLVEHTGLQIYYVMKCIRKSLQNQESFQCETDNLKLLKHPDIPILYDIRKDKNYYYIIEEFMKGEPLSSANAVRNSIHTSIRYIIQLCEITEYLHGLNPEPIYYLDFHPGNILVDGMKIKLVDFGNSRRASVWNRQKYFKGTPGYAAPEQYKRGILDARADVYGIGAVFFYLLTGKNPLEKAGTENIIPAIFERIIRKCLNPLPEERFASAAELREALLPYEAANSIKPAKIKTVRQKSSLVISIAGSVKRAGITHICFGMAAYLQRKGIASQYEEINQTNAVRQMAGACGLIPLEGMYVYQSVPLYPHYEENIRLDMSYADVRILDIGMLTAENQDIFLQADLSILVCGIKPWECMKAEVSISEKNVIFFINFAESRGYYVWKKGRDGRRMKHSYRVPYFQNPFAGEKLSEDFFEAVYQEQIKKFLLENNRDRREKWKRFFRKRDIKRP